MEKNNVKIMIKRLLCTLIVLGFFCCVAVGLYYFANIRYDIVYGIYDSMTGKTTDVTESVSPETVRISAVDAEKLPNVVFVDYMPLINSAHGVDYDNIPELIPLSDVMVAGSIADALTALSDAVREKFGTELLYISGYRSKESQAAVIESEPAVAAKLGTSEHETGLSVDVGIDGYKQRRFIISDVGKWVNENCWRYGFIIRYPYFARSVTGIAYEPWHLRYVGEPHAGIIMNERLTLEEYTGEYFGKTETGFVSAFGYTVSHQSADDGYLLIPKTDGTVYLAEDNCGGYFVWTKNG